VRYEELDKVSACTGCGFSQVGLRKAHFCCMKAPCPLVQFRGGEWKGCQYLCFDGNRHWCGFVVIEALYPGLLKVNVREELAIYYRIRGTKFYRRRLLLCYEPKVNLEQLAQRTPCQPQEAKEE